MKYVQFYAQGKSQRNFFRIFYITGLTGHNDLIIE